MKGIGNILFACALVSLAGSANAQDLGNGVRAADNLVKNLDTVAQSLLFGDVTGTVNGAGSLVTDLVTDVTDGSPATGVSPLVNNLVGGVTGRLTESLTPRLDNGGAALAGLLEPVTTLYFPSALLSNGVPFLNGERVVLLEQEIGLTGGLPLEQLNRLIRVDLLGPGDGDQGGVLIPLAGGSGGMLFEGTALSGATLLGGALESGEGPLASLLASGSGTGSLPLLGAVLSGGGLMLSPMGSDGLAPGDIALPLADLDPATVAALVGGSALPGLPQ